MTNIQEADLPMAYDSDNKQRRFKAEFNGENQIVVGDNLTNLETSVVKKFHIHPGSFKLALKVGDDTFALKHQTDFEDTLVFAG